MLKTHLLPIILVGFLFFIAQSINHTLKKPLLVISRDDSALNFNNDFLTLFTLGQRRMISSILWIHTLLQSDHKHYKKKNLNSWMYLRFRTIAHIDPKFYQNYLFGGQYLSVIKDDLLGASEIYRLGLIKFDDDFWLNFHGAYHYYFEMKEIDRALAYYEKIQYHPIAQNKMRFIPSLIARIKAKRGNLENAFFLLKKPTTILQSPLLLKKLFIAVCIV